MISVPRRKRAQVTFLQAFRRSSQTPGHCLEGAIFDRHVVRDATGKPTTIGGLFQVSDALSQQFADEAYKACYPLALEFSVEKNDLELVPENDCLPIGLEIKKIDDENVMYVDSENSRYHDKLWWKNNEDVYENLVQTTETFRWHFFNVLSSSLVQARWTPNLRMMYTAVVCRNCGGRLGGAHCLNAIGETPDFTLLDWYNENKDLEGEDRVAQYLTPLRYILFQVWHAEKAVLAATNGYLRYEFLEDAAEAEVIRRTVRSLMASIHMHNMAERFSTFAANDKRNWFRYTTEDDKRYYLDIGAVPLLAVLTQVPEEVEDPAYETKPVLHEILMKKMVQAQDRESFGMEWGEILDVFRQTKPKDLDFRQFPDQVFAIRKFGIKPKLPVNARQLMKNFGGADKFFAFGSPPVSKAAMQQNLSHEISRDVRKMLLEADRELKKGARRGALSAIDEFALRGVLARKLPDKTDEILERIAPASDSDVANANKVKDEYRKAAERYALNGQPSLSEKYQRSKVHEDSFFEPRMFF